MSQTKDIRDLLAIMARLRTPVGGCPWDIEQSFATIAPYTIEEAYEVADAIDRADMVALKDELGDLLLQVVYHAQMAAEIGQFRFADVVGAICDKMVRRHPHVFDKASIGDATTQTRAWEAHKDAERQNARAGTEKSALDGVALALPALTRALKLQRRAARVGFNWPEIGPIYGKIDEELAELRAVLAELNPTPERIQDELGDLIFACVNLARHLNIDPEVALRGTNAKFDRRFRSIEASLAGRGRTTAQATLAEMDALWEHAKAEERRNEKA